MIRVDAAVAEIGPVAAVVVGLVEVKLFDMQGFLEVGSLIEDASESVGDEAATPELHTALKTSAVDAHHGDTVGDSVAALDGLPGIVLFAVIMLILTYIPADSGGIEENLRAHESGDAGGFGVPLVPAYEHANVCELGLENLVAEVSRGEVELLVIARVVGDVHLAVFAEVGTVGIDDCRGVMIQTFSAFLEHGADNHNAEFLGEGHKMAGGGTIGDGLGECEILIALLVAKIERSKKLLETYDLGANCRTFSV